MCLGVSVSDYLSEDRKDSCLQRFKEITIFCLFVCLMVFNATINIISVISWQSVLLVEETRVPKENHRHVASH